MLLLPLKKVTAPAPWAAAEPETTGQNFRPNQINAAVVLPTIINIKRKIGKFRKIKTFYNTQHAFLLQLRFE